MKRTPARSRLEWLLVAPWRLALLVALTLALPVLVVNETAVRGSGDRLAGERRAEALAAAGRSASLVDVWIFSLRQRLAGAVEIPDLKAATRARDVLTLASLMDGVGSILPSGVQEKDVVRMSILDADGKIIYGFFGLAGIEAAPGRPGLEGTRAGDDLSSTEFFQEVARASNVLGSVDPEDVYVTDVFRASSLPAFDPATGRALDTRAPTATPDRIVLAAPIKFGLDPFVGVLVAEIDRRSAAPFLAASKGNVRDVYLIDRSGRLISRAADPGDGARELGGLEPVASALGGSLGVVPGVDPIDGAAALVATARVPDTGWVTLAVRTSTAADAAADATLQQQRLAGGGLAVILVLGSLLVGVASSRSIRRRDALAESLEQQTATSDVLKTISRSAFHLQGVIDTVTAAAGRLAGADAAFLRREGTDAVPAVYSYWSEREELRSALEAASPLMRQLLPHEVEPARAEGTIIGAVKASGRTLHVADVTAAPELSRASLVMNMGGRTVLAAPLTREAEITGYLLLVRTHVEPFDERSIRLVETFADQAAIAIENVRLYSETKESLEQQTATSEVLKLISRSTFDIQPVLESVVETAGRLARADAAWVRRIDGERGFHRDVPRGFHAEWGITPETSARLAIALNGLDQPGGVPDSWAEQFLSAGERLGDADLRSRVVAEMEARGFSRDGGSIMQHVTRERRTVHISDITEVPELSASGNVYAVGGRTVLAVPLIRQEAVVANMILVRTRVEPFTDREIALVETFADQAAIAIENTRLITQIQETSAQLASASKAKSEFLANMSHELRTPLNAIIGFSEVLADGMFGPLGDKQREYLEDIRSSGQHLLSLINDVLDLSKVEAGRMELELSEVSLSAVVDEALLLVRERAAGHGITLAVEVPPDLPPLTADARKLKQVLLNLVTNAVKFTPDGGWVGVTARREGDDVVISVRDTGVGIAPDDQARVFEEFRQAKRRDGSVEGTGLGLALTKKIVELHAGRISVESEVGKGSTFTIRMPLRPAAVAS